MGKATLPDTPEKPLDEEVLGSLIQKTIETALRDLSQHTPGCSLQTIYRANADGNGWGGYSMSCPFYQSNEVWDAIDKVWDSPESQALADYLWKHGQMKITMGRDGDGIPERKAWERHVWGDLIHTPLLLLLEDSLIKDMVQFGVHQPWNLDKEEIPHATKDVARKASGHGVRMKAICPIVGLDFDAGIDHLQLESGVSLYKMTKQRQLRLLSKHGREFLPMENSSWLSGALIEIDGIFPIGDANLAATSASVALDKTHWALMVACKKRSAVEEGPVLITSISSFRGRRTLRRGSISNGTGYWPSGKITEENKDEVIRLFSVMNAAQQLAGDELERALWHLGRACNILLDRDVLLESVIGLEHLLVPDPGESTYKMILHGNALLAPSMGDAIGKEISQLYRLRSSAAHGGKSDERKLKENAPRAREILASAIWAVVERVNDGRLDVAREKGNIGKAVKTFVFDELNKAIAIGDQEIRKNRPS